MTLLATIESTLQDYVEIIPCLDQKIRDPLISQAGNILMIPSITELPFDREGNPMMFLAQINFKEVPSPLVFPMQGVLQFYISYKSLQQCNIQEEFTIRYISEKELTKIKLCTNITFTQLGYPLFHHPYQLTFRQRKMTVPCADYGFNDVYDEIFKNKQQMDKFEKSYFENYARSTDHRLGGYQTIIKNQSDNEILLLQLAFGQDLNFGGTGFIAFLASYSQLLSQDFNDVECQVCWHQ